MLAEPVEHLLRLHSPGPADLLGELAAAVGQRDQRRPAGRWGRARASASPFASRASTTSVTDRGVMCSSWASSEDRTPPWCDSTRTARICDGVTSNRASDAHRGGAQPPRDRAEGVAQALGRRVLSHGNRVARFGVVTS